MTADLFIHPLTSNPIDSELLQVRVQELATGLLEASGIEVPVRVEHTGTTDKEGRELGVFVDGTWIATVQYGWRERLRIGENEVEEYERFGEGNEYPPEMVGAPYPYLRREFKATISDEHFEAMNFIGHLYYVAPSEHPAADIIAGFVAAGIAEQVDGRLTGSNDAFDLYRHGETAAEFLAWWGSSRIAWFGHQAFTDPRGPQQKIPEII